MKPTDLMYEEPAAGFVEYSCNSVCGTASRKMSSATDVKSVGNKVGSARMTEVKSVGNALGSAM